LNPTGKVLFFVQGLFLKQS